MLRRYSTKVHEFSHVVIGGGIVGSAIAAELQNVGHNVLLIEQHATLGTETTSRNSEVIHAGLYYPSNSLKLKLCLRGKYKIYNELPKEVSLRNCGKWIIASNDSEFDRLLKLHEKSKELQIPVELISRKAANLKLPLINTKYDVLHSSSTGIISSHDYLLYLQVQFENAGGTVATNTKLQDLEYTGGEYSLQLVDVPSGEEFSIDTSNIVNAAGLGAPEISNKLLPLNRLITPYFAKGNYFTYHKSVPDLLQKLIYPVPNPQATSLGTHLTFDLGGQIKFGPDLEWLPDVKVAEDIDYTPNNRTLERAIGEIKKYFPSLDPTALVALYTGVRPKYLSPEQSKTDFADFIIREEEGFPGFVNLIGIELPGLTAASGIAEYVRDLYR